MCWWVTLHISLFWSICTILKLKYCSRTYKTTFIQKTISYKELRPPPTVCTSILFFDKKFGWVEDPTSLFRQCPKFWIFFIASLRHYLWLSIYIECLREAIKKNHEIFDIIWKGGSSPQPNLLSKKSMDICIPIGSPTITPTNISKKIYYSEFSHQNVQTTMSKISYFFFFDGFPKLV